MNAVSLPKQRMKVPAFLAWANEQLDTNYELVDGDVVAIAPDRLRHNLMKAAVYRALEDAAKAARLPSTVFTDGVGVVINEDTTRIPDASVQCRVNVKPRSMVLEAPLIVAEVTSPSSEQEDRIDDLSVPSIRRYLVVLPERRAVLHDTRNEGGWLTCIGRDGDIVLDPPGIKVPVAGLVGPWFDDDAEAGQ